MKKKNTYEDNHYYKLRPFYGGNFRMNQSKIHRAETLVETMRNNPVPSDWKGFGEIDEEIILCAIDELKMLLVVNGYSDKEVQKCI